MNLPGTRALGFALAFDLAPVMAAPAPDKALEPLRDGEAALQSSVRFSEKMQRIYSCPFETPKGYPERQLHLLKIPAQTSKSGFRAQWDDLRLSGLLKLRS